LRFAQNSMLKPRSGLRRGRQRSCRDFPLLMDTAEGDGKLSIAKKKGNRLTKNAGMIEYCLGFV
jgi:hypothetical protein